MRGGEHSIDYVIQTNATLTPEWSSQFEDSSAGFKIEVREANDEGLYDALRLGFSNAEDADVYCYLGAGDRFSPHALEIVASIVQDHPDVEWLTGLIVGYNNRGHTVETGIPFEYRSRLIQCGAYGRQLPFIQQESTFWRRRLHTQIDWQAVAQLQLAGDAAIWKQFSKHARLHVVEAWLGGFESRLGQLSAKPGAYRHELEQISDPTHISDHIMIAYDRVLWHAPRKLKRALSSSRFIYDEAKCGYVRT